MELGPLARWAKQRTSAVDGPRAENEIKVLNPVLLGQMEQGSTYQTERPETENYYFVHTIPDLAHALLPPHRLT